MSAMRITSVGELSINDIGKEVAIISDGTPFVGTLTRIHVFAYPTDMPPSVNLTIERGSSSLGLKDIAADYMIQIAESPIAGSPS